MAADVKKHDADFPELTDEQLARMRPAREIMPPAFFEAVKHAQSEASPAENREILAVSLRIDSDVQAALAKVAGDAWQERGNAILRDVLKVGQR